MTTLKNFESLANTMKDWSDTAGDHHWQAGCAIEQLAAENERLREENEGLLFANRYNADMYRQIDDERKRLQAEVGRLREVVASDTHLVSIKRLFEAEQERDQLKTQINDMKQALDDLVSHSFGVAGLHLNGEVARWCDLMGEGRFCEWLAAFDDTSEQCLAAHDAEVIERALELIGYPCTRHKDFGVDYTKGFNSACEMISQQAKQHRQQAKED